MALRYVIHEDDLPARPVPSGAGQVRIAIDERSGARNILQRIVRLGPGESRLPRAPVSEDAVYVVEGAGDMIGPGGGARLRPGMAMLIPPMTDSWFVNPGPGDLVLVSVMSPPPRPGAVPPRSRVIAPAWMDEGEEEPLPAGEDRYFKLLIDPLYGCRSMTQFVGFIQKSKAPLHAHTYEEAIYILEGHGIVHIGERHLPIRRGSSIFLPPGTLHCLENEGPGTLKLLGVFSPAGSPAARRDATRSAASRGVHHREL